MKKLLFIVLLAYAIVCNSQEIFCLGQGLGADLDFEYPTHYNYVKIDTDHVWFITRAEKEILFADTPNNKHSLITDTSDYYKNNIKSSVNFKLCFSKCEDYTIMFWHKYDFERNKDGGIIETSHDNGLTWQNIIHDTLIMNNIKDTVRLYNNSDIISSYGDQPGYTGRQSEDKSVRINFYAREYMLEDTMLLRFTISTDSTDAQNEGWMLDDFHFYGEETAINYRINDIKPLVYPNPASSYINIYDEQKTVDAVKIISLTGETIIEKKGGNICTLNIDSLAAGFYLLVCRNEHNDFHVLKLMKQ
ncbi:MAG: T9SS type A sorting domain-containing protein [Bacteroidales bacterium]|nr:T9SS type A sorting domain-containing protein [Bacteroidales bacterium]